MVFEGENQDCLVDVDVEERRDSAAMEKKRVFIYWIFRAFGEGGGGEGERRERAKQWKKMRNGSAENIDSNKWKKNRIG